MAREATVDRKERLLKLARVESDIVQAQAILDGLKPITIPEMTAHAIPMNGGAYGYLARVSIPVAGETVNATLTFVYPSAKKLPESMMAAFQHLAEDRKAELQAQTGSIDAAFGKLSKVEQAAFLERLSANVKKG